MSSAVRGVAPAVVEVVVLGLCVAGAAAADLALRDATGADVVAALPFDLGIAAAALAVAAAWTRSGRRTRLVALAVATLAAAPLLQRGAGPDPGQELWALAAHVATLGAVGLLVLAMRAGAPRPSRVPAGLVVVTAVLVVAIVLVRSTVPDAVAPAWLAAGAAMVAWSGAGAMGLVLVGFGLRPDRPLLRQVGLAFAALAAGHATALLAPPGTPENLVGQALVTGGLAFLAVACAVLLAATVRDTRARLADADAVLAGAAVQRHPPLPAPRSGDHDGAAVAPLLRDLAVVHRSSGLAVEVDVEPGLQVAMDGWALGQVITTLLVNCERHAPGARVWVRGHRSGGRARLEVVDDGPGLSGEAAPEVLRHGTHGLVVAAELVDRYGGTFTLTSAGQGCTATLDLPVWRERVA